MCCCCMSTLADSPDSGQSEWAGLLGKFPLCGQQIYTKWGCFSLPMSIPCVCKLCGKVHNTAWSLWLVVWPEAIFIMKNRRWHTHTRWSLHVQYVFKLANRIPCHQKQNKNQLSNHVTVDNVALLLPTYAFWATRQPTLFSFEPHFNPATLLYAPAFTSDRAVSYLGVSHACQKPQFHPLVHPDNDTDHCECPPWPSADKS